MSARNGQMSETTVKPPANTSAYQHSSNLANEIETTADTTVVRREICATVAISHYALKDRPFRQWEWDAMAVTN